MTKQLTPRSLDVVITKISSKTVYYQLTANGTETYWRIPDESKFDRSAIQVGERYRVTTRVIRSRQWDRKKNRHIVKERFDWVSVQRWSPVAPCTVRPKLLIDTVLTSMSLADDGELFRW